MTETTCEILPGVIKFTRGKQIKYEIISNSLVEVEGFEPSKSETTDLQSAPFDHSGTPPK